MVFDQQLGDRMSSIAVGKHGAEAKNMFGGIAYLVNGNMACGVNKEKFIGRDTAAKAAQLIKKGDAEEFDFTGKKMSGFFQIDKSKLHSDAVLGQWVKRCVDFANTLPSKTGGGGKKQVKKAVAAAVAVKKPAPKKNNNKAKASPKKTATATKKK